MIDLSHPMAKHVMHASGLLDGVLVRGQKMSVSPSSARTELLTSCLSLFDEMRQLAVSRFTDRAGFILAAANEYESAARTLAMAGGGRIADDRRDGQGLCPVCDGGITRFRPMPNVKGYEDYWLVYCKGCHAPLSAAHASLCSTAGFCTWPI